MPSGKKNSFSEDLVEVIDSLFQRDRAEKAQRERESAHEAPIVITTSKTKPFWREKSFWKDGDPMDIIQVVEERLKMSPSPRQKQILYDLAGRDPFEWDTTYQQYVFAIGQGGGKNKFIVSPYVLYIAYKIANMKDPWMYFSRFLEKPLDRSVKFEISNSSLVNALQAENVHFENMKSLIRRFRTQTGENWFEKYCDMDTRQAFGGIKNKEISIPTLPGLGEIILHSFDSSPSAPEGLSLIVGIVDEMSRADTPAKFASAVSLWRVIKGNLNTRFPRNIGRAIAFSYLNNSQYDYTWTLLKEAEELEKEKIKLIYAVNLASWDTNPNISKNDLSVKQDYKSDPQAAAARYEGKKGIPEEGFYQPHPETVPECFMEMETPVNYEYVKRYRTVRDPNTKRDIRKAFTAVNLLKIAGDTRVRGWAFDAGEKYDAFILKGGYVETMDERRDELFIDNRRELVVVNKRPVIDIVIVWQPEEDVPVDYESVGDVLGVLLSKFPNSRFANSDKWQSVKLSQEIMSRHVHSETYHFSRKQQFRLYLKMRWLIWNNIPKFRYVSERTLRRKGFVKTVGEWNVDEHLSLLRENMRVDHPTGGSKDMSDVDAMLVNDLISLETKPGAVAGASPTTDPAMLAMLERYIIERQKMINAGIDEKQWIKLIAVGMGLTEKEIATLKQSAQELNL